MTRSRRKFATIVAIGAHVTIWAGALSAGTSTERIATGFSRPIFAAAPPGDTERLFVAEQHTGRIEILDLNSGTNLGVFLDINGLATENEQGLLGLTFDPDYASNGYFYVNVTTSSGGDTAVRRYQAQGDPSTSNLANPRSAFNVITYAQPQTNHNGGWIGFGPQDGYLYIASGDGGAGNDIGFGHTSGTGNAQDITGNLLGKILRIDPSREAQPTVPYSIPASNPLVGKNGDDEIWAFGLRNPYRASFDRQTGDLWIGDVGQGAREEIDFQPADSRGGENYGWRLREGSIMTPTRGIGGPPPEGNVEPVYDYLHGNGAFQGNAVLGGYVYRGSVAALEGHYIFADNTSRHIWKLDPQAIDIPASVTRINELLAPDVGSIGNLGSFSEDAVGELYLVEVFGGGDIFKIVTDSQEIVWDGDAAVGTPGDGANWSAAENWTRGGLADEAFVAEDHVIFAPGSSPSMIRLGGNRTVSAATFAASYTLQEDQLQVLSGNVHVDTGVTAVIESDLDAESPRHSLRKLGEGTLLIDGNAVQTVVMEGTLGGSGVLDHLTAKAGTVVAPGDSAGMLHVDNSFTLEAGATLAIELRGTDNSDLENPQYDQLLVGGAAHLGGTLEVSLIDEFRPAAGDDFSILTAAGGTDVFANTDLPAIGPDLQWQLDPAGGTLVLSVVDRLPGDYNRDGVVAADDYTVWRNTLGHTVLIAGSLADGDADGTINQGDFDVWQDNFGATGGGSEATIPEPSAVIHVMLAGLLLLHPPLSGKR